MGFNISVWSADYGIAATHIVVADMTEQLNTTRYYGNPVFEMGGFTGTATFTATPAASYKFKQWVYRIGGDDAEPQTSTDNPFKYKGADHNNADIIIRAESENAWGGDDNTQWLLSGTTLGYIDSYQYGEPVASFTINPKTMYRFTCQFRNQGAARIFTSGSTDTVGYISTAKDFHASSGEPYFIDEWASDNGYDNSGNFLFGWNVEADTTYYIWVRGQDDDTEGQTYLYIEAPEAEDPDPGPDEPDDDNWSMNAYSLNPGESYTLYTEGKNTYRFGVTFQRDITARFYSTGDLDLVGYVGTSDEFDKTTGKPVSYLYENDNKNVITSDFYIEWEAKAGTTYYLWAKGWSPNDVDTSVEGEFTVHLSPPEYWSVASNELNVVDAEVMKTANLDVMQVQRFAVKFNKSGEAKFYSFGSTDLCAYLSTTTDFDNVNGKPTSDIAFDDNSGYNGWNFSMTYTVTANTQYYLWVRRVNGIDKAAIGFYIKPPVGAEPVVAKWDWSLSNGEASAEKTSAAHSNITNNGPITDFSFLVWNDLCTKVASVLAEAGLTWDDKYATYDKTKMSQEDRKLTSARFNSLRYNIGSHYATGIQEEDAAPGKDVLGRYFTTLASCINDWIDTL